MWSAGGVSIGTLPEVDLEMAPDSSDSSYIPDTFEVMLTTSSIALHHDHILGNWMLCANGTGTWIQRTRLGDYGYVREGDR